MTHRRWSAVFVHFLKIKSDMVQATTKFLADTAPYGQFKCIRFGNETEFMGKDYQNRKNAIRHDTSVPQHLSTKLTTSKWYSWAKLAHTFWQGQVYVNRELTKELWTYDVLTNFQDRHLIWCWQEEDQTFPNEKIWNNLSCLKIEQEKSRLRMWERNFWWIWQK